MKYFTGINNDISSKSRSHTKSYLLLHHAPDNRQYDRVLVYHINTQKTSASCTSDMHSGNCLKVVDGVS